MNKFLLGIGVALAAAPVLIFLMIINTLLGIVVGWAVGLFFSETILGIFAVLGIKGFAMWQLGAFLGFVGGFFRCSQYNKKSE